ncbi:MAG: D-alanyl-D-alanine carboxypeptidase [Fusobacterium sp.]|nr:D-alanyl-D-alanine carboxypeptidase [Fusobacterium sp.]
MLSKFYRVLCLILILNLSVVTFSEVKEIITIEEYSKQFLDENFILEDMKKEEINSSNEENVAIDEEEISEEKYKEEMAKIEEIQEKEAPKEIKNSESSQEISVEKENEEIKKADKVLNESTPPKKNISSAKINWNLPNNFRAALIGDLNGEIYYSKNADKVYPLASVTKMMTLMVTFDEIKAGRVSLKDKVKITSDVANHGGSGIPLKVGQVFILEDLMKASAIHSANNATYAIAKHVGKGSIPKFIGMMNKKIEKLGLQKDIKYYTPAGLPTRMTKKPMDAGTARAIYKLSIEALKYKKYMEIAGIKNTKIHSGRITIRNRNHLIGKEGVYGIKTGYHKEAKYNIAVASKIDGGDVVIVVMGGETYTSRDKVVLELIKIFKENYKMVDILDRTKSIGKVKIMDTNINVPVVPDKNYKRAMLKSQDYKIVIKQRENIKLNVFKGEDLGEYQVYIDGKIVTKGRILAQRAVKK